MKRIIMISWLVCSLSGTTTMAQNDASRWSLRRCIDHALEYNMQLKQQEANCEQQKTQLSTARNRRLPDLSGGVSQSFNFGRGLTQNNTYANRNTQNSSFSLSTNVPLFTGMEIPNSIALNKLK